MTRSYRCRLLPTARQARVLADWLRITRELYNAALQERRDAWRKQQVSVRYFDQAAQLADVRKERGDCASVPVVILRGALYQLNKVFAAFFRRCKAGEKPGYPRYKADARWNALYIDQIDAKAIIVAGGKRVAIPLLGKAKFKQGERIKGTPKALRLTFDGRKWFVTFTCVSVQTETLPATGATVGIDLGIHHLVATSDGEMFENPRPLGTARLVLERAARRLCRRRRNSHRRHEAARLLAKAHAHVANVRRETAIDVARSLVGRYDTIFVEDLNTKGLARSALAKSVHDAAWGKIVYWLNVKAEEAGRSVVDVAPHGTSQTCSKCGAVAEHKLTLAVRWFRCSQCGYEQDRDTNAALNIKGSGTALQGAAPLVRGRL